MHIVLLLKPPQTTHGTTSAATWPFPCDRAARETALVLAGNDPSTHITALTAGPREGACALLDTVGSGIHKAFYSWDAAVEERAACDASVVSRLLATAIEHLGADLVLTGAHSGTRSSGTTGPAVAHFLRIPHLTQVGAVEKPPGRACVYATQQRVSGDITLTLPLPAVLTISRGPSAPAAESTAPAPTAEPLTPEALGFDPDDAVGPARPTDTQIEASTATLLSNADELAQRLRAMLEKSR